MQDPSTHGPNPPAPPLRRSSISRRYRVAIAFLAFLGVVALAWSIKRGFATSHVAAIGYTELLAHAGAGDVAKAEIDGERVSLKLKNGSSAMAVVSNAHSQHAVVALFA